MLEVVGVSVSEPHIHVNLFNYDFSYTPGIHPYVVPYIFDTII